MSKNFKNSLVSIIAIVILIAMSLTGIVIGQTSGIADAKSLDAEATKLSITRSVDAMTVGQISQFVAEVTFDDETTSNDVVWSSDDESIATVSADGAVKALKVGTVNITAAYGENLTASVNIQVYEASNNIVGIHLSEYMLVMRVDEEHTFEVSSPYDVLTWTISDEETLLDLGDGTILALAEGKATVTVSAINPDTEEVASSASCLVSVIPADSATLDKTSITYTSVNATAETLTVSLPDGVEAASYEWYSLYSDVASVDPDDTDESICAIQPWRFGSTIITVVVTGTDDVRYGAYCNVMVTSDTFFITGEQNGWIGLPNDAWNLTQTSKGVYTIKTNLWAYSGFQIIHNGIDKDWTTKLTPWWYDGNHSNDNYVANTDQMFEVTTYGIYDVTLDLNQGLAKVSIVFDKAYTTSVDFDFTTQLWLHTTEQKADVDISALPEGSIYNPADVRYVISEADAEYVNVALDVEAMTISVTLKATYTDPEPKLIPITVYIGEAYAEFTVTLISTDTYGYVESITFEYPEGQTQYELNVNNGEQAAWSIPIIAYVNAGASVDDIIFTTNSRHAYVDVDEEGNATFIAGELGTYTITATSVGLNKNNERVTKTATVLVYSNAPYLIGTLNGETPNNWTSLPPSDRTLEGTPFEPWALLPVDGSKAIYFITTDLNQNDVFSIAFLGMTGNWNGALRYANLNRTDSDMQYLSENDNNVQILERAKYTITMDLTTENPSFTVKYAGAADPDVDIDDLYVYILRAGDAWDGNATNVGNVLVASTEKVDVNEEGGIKTITLEYDFSNFGTALPTIQFVTATEANAETGEFVNPTWYNSGVTTVEISGTAFISGDVTENAFTNGGSGCQLWLEGELQYSTVSFTFNFDFDGNITSIEMNYVVPVEA